MEGNNGMASKEKEERKGESESQGDPSNSNAIIGNGGNDRHDGRECLAGGYEGIDNNSRLAKEPSSEFYGENSDWRDDTVFVRVDETPEISGRIEEELAPGKTLLEACRSSDGLESAASETVITNISTVKNAIVLSLKPEWRTFAPILFSSLDETRLRLLLALLSQQFREGQIYGEEKGQKILLERMSRAGRN